MSTSLCFNDVKFDVVERDGQPWVTARQLAQALGYVREDSVLKVYERNKDEFSPMMTATVKMTVGLTEVMVRVFSMRGCHLIAMFARTPVAKAFRKWVLDVLDKMTLRVALPTAKAKKPVQKALPKAEQKALPAAKLTIEEDIALFAEEVRLAHAQVYAFRERASEKLVARAVEIMERLTTRACEKIGFEHVGKIYAIATELLPHIVTKTREVLCSPHEHLLSYDDPAKLFMNCIKLERRW